MSGTTWHLKVDIKGALMHWDPNLWEGCVTGDNGEILTPSQVKSEWIDALLRGERYISCAAEGECPDFDPKGKGCPGHPHQDPAAVTVARAEVW